MPSNVCQSIFMSVYLHIFENIVKIRMGKLKIMCYIDAILNVFLWVTLSV